MVKTAGAGGGDDHDQLMFPLRVFRDQLREPLFCLFLCVEAGDELPVRTVNDLEGHDASLRSRHAELKRTDGLRLSLGISGPPIG